MADKEYKDLLRKFHEKSNKHVLVLESDVSYLDCQKILSDSEKLRKAGNELTGFMNKKYIQFIRTKKYKKLVKLLKNKRFKKEDINKQLDNLKEKYNLTWDVCRKHAEYLANKYNVKSVLMLTKAEDVWRGVETCLYRNGKHLNFAKFGDYSTLRAKQIDRCIILKVKDDNIYFIYGKIDLNIKKLDAFQKEELEKVLKYLESPEVNDKKAIKAFESNKLTDTFRPCYATLVPQKIRGKYRIYIHLTIEGKASIKRDKNGKPRHKYKSGIVASDIGTQTRAIVTDKLVELKNLAERGNNILENERKERLLYRAMERSRRATNPQNYNEDDTVKKGPKTWKYSKRYKKLRDKHKDLCRKNSVNRHLSINEDVNYLRSLGDTFITEPKNASKLAKKSKNTTFNKKGKINRKKRFGKSVKNRCPGYFQERAKQKFISTGGTYIEVPIDYKASQYEHIKDDYIKKKLSQRMFNLDKNIKVQRDLYSAFLLFCYKDGNIDKDKCNKEFDKFYKKQNKFIKDVKKNNIKILNSGIK